MIYTFSTMTYPERQPYVFEPELGPEYETHRLEETLQQRAEAGLLFFVNFTACMNVLEETTGTVFVVQ